MNQAKVIIVGAGLAGLYAARLLVKAGIHDLLVLEARDRVGGRTLNAVVNDRYLTELGGQWLGPGQSTMYELAKQLGVETFPTYNKGRNLFFFAGRRLTFGTRQGALPRLKPWQLVDLLQGTTRFETLMRRVALESPERSPGATRLDSQTFASWIKKALRTALGRHYFELVTEAVLAADPADVSLLHVLYYFRSGSGLASLTSVQGGAQQDRLVGGSQVLSRKMAGLLGEKVLLNRPVLELNQSADEVIVETAQGRHRADYVILAVPPVLMSWIRFRPALPGDRAQLLQRLPAGSVIKFAAVYQTPFWRERGLSGQVVGDEGPVKLTFDNSPPEKGPGILTGFVEAGAARRMAGTTADERKALILQALKRYFGSEAEHPVTFVDKDWAADPWARGGYGAYAPPGVWSSYGSLLRRPLGRIHMAGSETAVRWNGYMEGALRSGERAVQEIMERLN